MKLTVLCDNCARVGAYYLAEPGVAYLLEDEGMKILLDTGFSDAYVRNAAKLGIDLSDLTAIVISHGHDDHTGGLIHLPEQKEKRPLYGHPQIFERKRLNGEEIGAPYTKEQAAKLFDLHLSAEPVQARSAVKGPGLARGLGQFSSRDERGRWAARNSIWSARMRRLRRMKSSHRLGT